MFRLFTEHPRSVGESYLEHQRFACTFGARMVVAGLACFIHGFLPFLFQTTGSSTVLSLHERMVRMRADTIRRWAGADRRSESPRATRTDRRAPPEPEYLI